MMNDNQIYMTTRITVLTWAWNTLLITQVDSVGSNECIIPEIKSRHAAFEKLSPWITARMWWTTEPLPVLCPRVLILIFADSPFPKPLYHPFSWTYFCSMSKEGLSPSITGMQPSRCRHTSFQVSRKYVATISCPILCNDKEKVEHERKRKIITQRHWTWVNDWLNLLLNCAKLTNKKGDENTVCQFFNFTQDCLASLQCIPIIKSLCVLNSDYLSSFNVPHSCSSSYSKVSTHTAVASHLTSIQSYEDTKVFVCLCVCMFVYVLKRLLSIYVQVTCDILKREPQKQVSFYFTFVFVRSVSTGTPVTRTAL